MAFFVAAGFGIVSPAIPVFARSFGVDRLLSGLVISAFALMRLISAFGVGKLVDRLGSRVILGTGIVIVAVSSALAGLAGNYGHLLALRAAGGVGSAMFSVSSAALLLGVTTSEQRGRAMGRFSGGFLIGGIAGPLLGGFVTSWSLRTPFFIYAGTLAAAGAVGLLMLPRHLAAKVDSSTRNADAIARPNPLRLAVALRMPAYRAAALTNLADNWAAVGVRAAIIPLFVKEVLHRSSYWTGIGFAVFTAANILTLLLGGRIADRRGRRPLLLAGCLGSAAGVALLLLPASVAVFLAGSLVFGLGSGLLDVAPGAMLGDVVGGRGGTVIAGYQMAGDLGSLAGPIVAGFLADHAGYDASFVSAITVLVLGALFASRAPETLRRESDRSAV